MKAVRELLGRGWDHFRQGEHAEAERLYRLALQLDSNSADAWFLLGNACQVQGKLDEAAAAYQRGLQLRPAFAEGHYQLGNLLARQGRFREAAACYHRVARLEPARAEALNNLGVMWAEQRRFAKALPCYHRAIALQPTYAEAHYNLANTLKELARLDEAVTRYREALRLRPEFAEAHVNLGIALAAQGKPADAVVCYQEALRLRPDHVEAHNNLGLAMAHLGQHDQALARYERALQLRPGFADAHYNRALTWLALGNFGQGWAEYEWRWRLAEHRPRPFAQPPWEGAPLHGKTILLHAEQGMGDTIQFIRFAPLVKQRGATVVVECQAALRPLLAGCRGIDLLVAKGTPLPPFDVHCPIMSLGRLFAAGLAPIPAQVPYLVADPERIERWRRELSGVQGFKIGIAWQGSSGYRWDRLRSIPLAHFAALARVPGVRLISLQKGPGTEQLAGLRDFEVLDLGARLDEGGAFLDTAALMHTLDLVVTSDTAAAHLAGALGRPVWVALSLAPEWRWLRRRMDSPWYPTMRLFRQSRFGDWDEVFEQMALSTDLGRLIAARTGTA